MRRRATSARGGHRACADARRVGGASGGRLEGGVVMDIRRFHRSLRVAPRAYCLAALAHTRGNVDDRLEDIAGPDDVFRRRQTLPVERPPDGRPPREPAVVRRRWR